MGGRGDDTREKFGPQKQRTLRNALAHRIGKEFPRMGGERIRDLCAEMVLEVVEEHLRPRDHQSHGQILWMAVSRDDPPSRGKTAQNTDMVPVVLSLVDEQDIDSIMDHADSSARIASKAVRLCWQAYEQGALLSGVDLALLLNKHNTKISTPPGPLRKRPSDDRSATGHLARRGHGPNPQTRHLSQTVPRR